MSPQTVPALRPGWRLQWEEVQGRHVLLYPEGMVQLNESAGAILALIDGQRRQADIVAMLEARFPEASGIGDDVAEFLDEAQRQGWLVAVTP
ncbi:MAG: pyrroloquinoline quinone biosynthesis peptide chaperone PqqD [Halomonas sp.]|jgi:pyrroloquinoline quinone biosynthesis protein D|uniref:PqqA binding protein n=1 Tax=Billgrantia tianxiuensis TaxID=2497861 RepID=A0A6I6SR99_9GAMM|nr:MULTISPECIES: pyrroloquinoline quinone biosynthesis peptide chaperone PqqD [Halomonas]MCE8034022.1 pyrroloquinoline quinone biosynthesis peptide chaperone PqqD [Halomonas sp. MCCC 1A11057]MDX5435430.1 pyrroloquinoline quinone biosynthesis peptide chaperone PqqD [Halomonas sp.]QHC51114.1 pyrroloquinoline quinone biosynthesis peptide chaperone PqqD [Halomonas tianxiuensis]